MKIRLTESQYSRLLKEDDKDFLDGMVNFKTIGNKVNFAIAKLFNMSFGLLMVYLLWKVLKRESVSQIHTLYKKSLLAV